MGLKKNFGGNLKKNLGKLSGLFLALALSILPAAPLQVKAAGEEYTYKIRFFAGAQGTIDGKDQVEYTECRYGQRVTFNQNRVGLADNSKYYIRGIRRSGRDNDEILSTASFEVTEDADYVVAYGILGDAVMYTVEYVDAAGNSLAPSETYYGNVGDRPVIAFAYIEGYQPQAYNLTGTLDRDASNNVFRFTYTPAVQAPEEMPAPQPEETPAPAQAPEETSAPDEGTLAPEETPAPEEPVAVIPEDDVPLADGPAEAQDINDPDVPLAEGGPIEVPAQANGFARMIGNIPLAAKILIGLAAVAAVGTAWFLLMYQRKKAVGKAAADETKKKA